MIARLRSLGVMALFGAAMFALGGIWTSFLVVMGEQFIHAITRGML